MATLVSAVVIVFSLTFIAERGSVDDAPVAAQLVVAPDAAGGPLRVRTLRPAPPLPRLRDAAPAAATVAPTAPPAAPSEAPSTGAIDAPVPPPSGSADVDSRLCVRAAWLQLTGGAPALPRTGRC